MRARLGQVATPAIALVVLVVGIKDANAQIVTNIATLNGVRANAWNSMSAPTVQIYGVSSGGLLLTQFSGVKTWEGAAGVQIGSSAHAVMNTLTLTDFHHFIATSRRDFFSGTEPIYTVQAFDVHPGYGGTAGSGTDFSRMLLQPGAMAGITPATIASSNLVSGNHVWGSGTGTPVVNGTALPFDGIMGTFENRVFNPGIPNYIGMLFPSTPTYPLMGGPTDGFSGGPVYNNQGELAAIFSTASLDFSVSTAVQVSSYSSFFTTPIPEPSTFVMTGMVAVYVGYRSRMKRRNLSLGI